MSKLITADTLRRWEACKDGFRRFCELFPDGADLQTASAGLMADGHPDWSNWLWHKCATDEEYRDQTVLTGGDGSTLTGGNWSTLTGGVGSTLTGGYGSKLTGGNWSTLTGGGGSKLGGGHGSKLTGGHWSTLMGGKGSTLMGGDDSTLMGGDGSTLMGGDGSIFFFTFVCNGRRMGIAANVGIDDIKPNTPYCCNYKGEIYEVVR